MLKTAPVREVQPVQPLMVRTRPVLQLTDEDFFELCQQNPELRLERTSKGEIVVMSPTGGETSYRNARLLYQLQAWAEKDGRGVVFDSSGGFALPNGAIRSPDAAWVLRSRLAHLTPEQKQRFLPLCPDFVAELRPPSDRLEDLQAKMEEYRENGARLGWLIDPVERQGFVYRPGQSPEHHLHPNQISGDPELPGFVLDLERIWEPGF